MPFNTPEKRALYNKTYYEKKHGKVGELKTLFCVTCNIEMSVPKNSGRKYCPSCAIKRRAEKAKLKYHEGPSEARSRAAAKHKEKYKNDPVYRLITRARNRAKEENMDFNLEPEDIIIPDVCPVLGTDFVFGTYYTESPDRIDNNKGYIKGNIQVMSWKANAMKNSATPKELLKFADWIYKTYKNEE